MTLPHDLRRGAHGQLARVDQFFDQFGVMHDFIIAAELVIFLAEIVQAVRAGHDDARGFDLVQRLDIACRQFEDTALRYRAPRHIARAVFHLAQHGEIDAGRVQAP